MADDTPAASALASEPAPAHPSLEARIESAVRAWRDEHDRRRADRAGDLRRRQRSPATAAHASGPEHANEAGRPARE